MSECVVSEVLDGVDIGSWVAWYHDDACLAGRVRYFTSDYQYAFVIQEVPRVKRGAARTYRVAVADLIVSTEVEAA